MDAKRITWLLDQAIASERKTRRVGQVNIYLVGSPMAGLGELIVSHADRTGVNFALCPAIAQAESTKGRVCPAFNAWGLGPGMSFGSWEQSVAFWFDNTLKRWGSAQRAEEFVNPEYCENPYQTWIPNVQGQVDYIVGIVP
ncbi:MAG: hypothetical protein JRD89_11070 [Deltaproteobacteria bacterium]|nr:hypothetical protein [Deltaproteobacteria bacterium]